MKAAIHKPIHMTNGDVTRTICGLWLDSPTTFSWVIPREEYRGDVTCKRCLYVTKHGWAGTFKEASK